MDKPINQYTIKLEKNPNKTSKVWDYFGGLFLEQKSVKADKIFCSKCLEDQKENDASLIFSCANVQSYSKNCSTGNLNRHLKNDHNIRDIESSNTGGNISNFFKKTAAVNNSRDRKWILARDLALWMARDLVPFNMISHSGIQEFLMKYKVAVNADDIPNRKTLSTTALDDVYDSILKTVKQKIANQKHFSITFDLWTDNFRRRSYITFTFHFLTSNFEMRHLTLQTQYVSKAHTAANILKELEDVCDNFNLQMGSNYVVTDQGSNIKKAINIGCIKNHFCLGHGLHNLLDTDGFNSVQEIRAFILKCKNIVRALRFKTHTLRCQADNLQKDILSKIDNLEELLDFEDKEWASEDEFSPIDDIPLDVYSHINDVNDISGSLMNQRNVTLKNSVPTRWHSVLAMLDSIACQRGAINKLLVSCNKTELILVEAESQLLVKLKSFLEKFKEVVNILSGDTYPSLCLALIIRTEIISLLNETEDPELDDLKYNIKRKLDYRFPMSDILVCASLLDPRFAALDCVETYCAEKKLTKIQFLMKMYKDLIGDVELNSQDNDDPAPSASKILKLVQRHSKNSKNTNLETECHLLLSLSSNQDVLLFWKEKRTAMPLLSVLAQKVLCIPATSTPSERVFSIAGLTITNKRSQLSPYNLNKIIFIHDNYEFCKETD